MKTGKEENSQGNAGGLKEAAHFGYCHKKVPQKQRVHLARALGRRVWLLDALLLLRA